MAKAPAKKTSETVKVAAPKKTPATKEVSITDAIEKACTDALTKLKALNVEPQLQSDIEWCLGSYSHDKNPVGLYEMIERAAEVFKGELSKKTKGVTAKFVIDLEKVIKL